MIQELLGGSNVNGIVGGERSKLSTPPILDASPSHNSPSSSSSSPAPHATAPENLRCPRCDSSNTKFCYYNNYNLTQPRHFCKTCRRYWTKGGALRNVPIGGGCRKNRITTVAAAVGKSSAAGKFKTVVSEMAKTGIFSCFEPADALSANPILWASSQNSHFLSLLRPQTQNLQNPISIKEQGMLFGSSHLGTSESSISNISANAMSVRNLGMDPFGPAHLPSSSLYRNQTLSGHGIMNNGLQELYQSLRLSSSGHPEHAPVILGSMASAISSTTSTILDSAPVATGELSFWNPTASWATDLTTTHGAYP